jgi:kynureninase
MPETHPAFCAVCHEIHDAMGVSDEQAVIISEDAQSPADYYVMRPHTNSKGVSCEGSGKAPEHLFHEEEDDGNYAEHGDFGDEDGLDDY